MKRLLALAALLCTAPLAAAPVVGVAPVGQDVALARSQALDDALLNAGLVNGARVYALEEGEGQLRAEAGQLRPANPVTHYRILREWQASGLYHIEIEALATPATPAAAPTAAATRPTPPQAAPEPSDRACNDGYRRKLLVTPFQLLHPAQGNDIAELQRGLQDVLGNRLDAAGFAVSRNGNETPVALTPGRSDPRLQPAMVRQLALQHGSQFVVAGLIHDLGTSGERYTLSYGAGDVRPGERKLDLSLPLLDFFSPGIKATPRERQFDAELLLFDGISGGLIARKRFTARASGKVVLPAGTRFDSASFRSSDYGTVVSRQLDAMVQATRSELGCLPFSARVVRVEFGQIHLDAGSLAGLKPGDRLQLYRLKPGSLPVDGLLEGEALRLGLPELLSDTLVITQTQPQFSIAQSGRGKAEVGDYARSAGILRH